jgi:glutamate formiminotransferase/formiminotetrahydrofolate cyclodeaminase
MKLRRATPEEAAARDAAVREATKRATEVPLGVLERTVRAAELAGEAVERGNRNSLSDAGVAALAARACAEGAYYNVLINLAGLDDAEWAAAARERAGKALEAVRRMADALADRVRRDLESQAGVPESSRQ